MARSAKDLQLIASEEVDPEDEADLRTLAGLEGVNRVRGDTGLADRLKMLIEYSRLSKSGAVFSLPDVPDANEAAAEVQELYVTEKNEPLPSPQTKSFFPVLRSFKAQAQEKGLLDVAAGFADLERRALAQNMLDWIEAVDWPTSRMYLQDHQELLCDEVDLMLSEMSTAARTQNQADVLDVMQQHLSILEQARRDGIQAAYVRLVGVDE